MKKLLVLVAMLSLVVCANATFTMSNVGDVISVNAVSSPILDTMLAVVSNNDGALTNYAKGINAPEDTQFVGTFDDDPETGIGFNAIGMGELWTMTSFAGGASAYPDGVWLTLNIPSGWVLDPQGPFVVTLYETADAEQYVELGSLNFVPEPITVALLGLGGLFIRRKGN